MLGINQLNFMSYATAFKSNYRKGVRRLEAILSNPTHAAEFAANLGGVSVVLGVPIGREDRNSEALLSLLLNSDIADDAVLTWMHQFYEFTTWDDLMGNSARVQEMMNNPLLWRALGGSKKAVGKGVATLAGLSCVSYADIDAVAASQTAMAAVIGNATALNAVVSSSTAMAAIQKSQTAKDAIAASSMATAKYAAGAAGLNPADYADMTVLAASSTAMAAIVASPTAMAAIWRNNSAVAAVQKNTTAWKTFTGATSAVMGKTVAILANLNPADYADMTAVVASSTAMTAVIGNATALNAVVSSQTAMTAVAASTTAMTAVEGSNAAVTALGNSPLKVTDSGGYGNTSNKRTVRSGKAFVLSVTFGQTSNTGYYGNLSTFMLGSSPYRATCTATPRAVNRFAKEIVCYGEFQSLNDNVNYSKVVYIPC